MKEDLDISLAVIVGLCECEKSVTGPDREGEGDLSPDNSSGDEA